MGVSSSIPHSHSGGTDQEQDSIAGPSHMGGRWEYRPSWLVGQAQANEPGARPPPLDPSPAGAARPADDHLRLVWAKPGWA